jgi:hypothetical protein
MLKRKVDDVDPNNDVFKTDYEMDTQNEVDESKSKKIKMKLEEGSSPDAQIETKTTSTSPIRIISAAKEKGIDWYESLIADIQTKLETTNEPLSITCLRILEEVKCESNMISASIVADCVHDTLNSHNFHVDPIGNLNDQDMDWKRHRGLLEKIDFVFEQHENSKTSEIKILAGLRNHRKERLNAHLLHREQQDIKWSKLETIPEKLQLKFFISLWGPIAGRMEYVQWKSIETMRLATNSQIKSMSDGYLKCDIDDDDDDDLLNECLL